MSAESEPLFLYFAFGSNLDRDKVRAACPSASFVSAARLAEHRLMFTLESRNTWHGGVADVRPFAGDEVWGALWLIAGEESAALDEQEGLLREPPAYARYRVTVETPAGDVVSCRSYQVATPDVAGIAPSPAFKQALLRGARACGLPAAYIDRLEAIADNGYVG